MAHLDVIGKSISVLIFIQVSYVVSLIKSVVDNGLFGYLSYNELFITSCVGENEKLIGNLVVVRLGEVKFEFILFDLLLTFSKLCV